MLIGRGMGDVVPMTAQLITQQSRIQAVLVSDLERQRQLDMAYAGLAGLGRLVCSSGVVNEYDPLECIGGGWVEDMVGEATPDITMTATETCNPNVSYGPADPCYAWQVQREVAQITTTTQERQATQQKTINWTTLAMIAGAAVLVMVAMKD